MISLVKTADGSSTFFHAGIGEHYHSVHGAVAESRHVFIAAGLYHVLSPGKQTVRVLEVGFGTGLNFLLSADHCFSADICLDYTGIEPHPLSLSLVEETGYSQYIDPALWEAYVAAYPSALEKAVAVTRKCILEVKKEDFKESDPAPQFDLLYYDAFSAIHHPEMWSHETLERYTGLLLPGGTFVTYAVTGNLKRMLKLFGFVIQKLPGAPGKREMLRAVKLP